MLKRRDRIGRLERAIAETEIAITEQILRIAQADAAGQDARTARRTLAALYGILVEYRHAGNLLIEARDLTKPEGPGPSTDPAAK